MVITTAERMPNEPEPVAPTRDVPADVDPLKAPNQPVTEPEEQQPTDTPDEEDEELSEEEKRELDREREERE